MVALASCSGCWVGRHDLHEEHHVKAPEGAVGGKICLCTGQCLERANGFRTHDELARMWFGKEDADPAPEGFTPDAS